MVIDSTCLRIAASLSITGLAAGVSLFLASAGNNGICAMFAEAWIRGVSSVPEPNQSSSSARLQPDGDNSVTLWSRGSLNGNQKRDLH